MPVAAQAAGEPGPETIAAGSPIHAKLSANGRWALISVGEGEAPERLFLRHVDESRARLVGTGGPASSWSR
jgi:hypothetical protein